MTMSVETDVKELIFVCICAYVCTAVPEWFDTIV